MKIFRSLTLAILLLVGFVANTQAQFSDVQKDSLNYLYKHHYVNGYPDGTFGPKKEINRAEFVTLLLRAENVPLTQTQNCFPDVKAGVWYHDYVCTAKELGYVQGYDDGLFHPEQFINKVEALKVVAEIQKWRMDLAPSTIPSGFNDIKASDWYYDYVNAAQDFVYIDVVPNFHPAKFITREEVAEILFRTILDKKFWMHIGDQDQDLATLARDFFKIEAAASQKTYADFEGYQIKHVEEGSPVFIEGSDGYTYAVMELTDLALESDDYVHTFPIVYAQFDKGKDIIAIDWDAKYSIAANGVGLIGKFKEGNNQRVTVDAYAVAQDNGTHESLYETFVYILRPARN